VLYGKVERAFQKCHAEVLQPPTVISCHLEKTRSGIMVGDQLQGSLARIDGPVHATHRHAVSRVHKFLAIQERIEELVLAR